MKTIGQKAHEKANVEIMCNEEDAHCFRLLLLYMAKKEQEIFQNFPEMEDVVCVNGHAVPRETLNIKK